MFKIKRVKIDKFNHQGSFVGTIFTMMDDGQRKYWKILSYDKESDRYTRSKVVYSSDTEMNIPYTIITSSHQDVYRYMKDQRWEIYKAPDNV